MGKVYMCGSFKGGVGKTVTTFNLAYSFAAMGKKVLAVDFDSQANLSTCFGIENTAEVPVSIGDLMMAAMEEETLPDDSGRTVSSGCSGWFTSMLCIFYSG